TRAIRELLEGNLEGVEVEGEVSNWHRHGSGHVYFTLKDVGAQIRAVMFRGEVMRAGRLPKDGELVVAEGDVTVYEPRGEYQLRVRRLRLKGKGSLQEQFEALKAKLWAEGLFDPERKRRLPGLVRRVAVVTSPTGAAVRDFVQVLQRRCPRVAIQVFGVKVQGPGAAEEVAEAVKMLNELGEVEVIVVARGGGSLEDLWAFNEEVVARAIAGSRIPVISGVGHEVDFTIADFAADVRAPTPSAAAEMLSETDAVLRRVVSERAGRLERLVRERVRWERERLERISRSPAFREPGRVVERAYQRLDDWALRLGGGLRRAERAAQERLRGVVERWNRVDPRVLVGRKREELVRRVERLRLLSPEGVLRRGFAMVFDEEKRLVRSAEGVAKGAGIRVYLGRGCLKGRVEEVDGEEGWGRSSVT
ncbi:MAG: exodeoxyribonuclease VII large subunit, partial [Verrucomicrobiia bacterium]